MKRAFQVDLEKCLRCGEFPPRAPARDPPYFQSQVIRRQLAEQLVLVA
jgi:hypothetical protein